MYTWDITYKESTLLKKLFKSLKPRGYVVWLMVVLSSVPAPWVIEAYWPTREETTSNTESTALNNDNSFDHSPQRSWKNSQEIILTGPQDPLCNTLLLAQTLDFLQSNTGMAPLGYKQFLRIKAQALDVC